MKGFRKQNLDFDEIVKSTRQLLLNGDYAKAIENLKSYRGSKDSNYYSLLAELYQRNGNIEESEICKRKAKLIDNNTKSKEKLRTGIQFLSNSKLREAEGELNEAIKLNPFEVQAYTELYNLYKKQYRYLEAFSLLEDVLVLKPFSEFPYLEMARLYYLAGKIDRAIDILGKGLLKVESATINFELGKLYFENGKLDRAINCISMACRLDFKNLDYREKLIEFLIYNTDYERALEVCSSTLYLYPGSAYVIANVASIYEAMGELDLSEFYYRLAVSSSDGFTKQSMTKDLADFLIDHGKFDQAEQELIELIRPSVNLWIAIDAFAELSLIYTNEDRHSDVVRIGEALLKHPDMSKEERCEILEIVTDALFNQGKFLDAKQKCSFIIKASSDRKLVKRCYIKLRAIEEIDLLENMLSKA